MNHPPRRSLSADRPPLQSKRLLDQLRERIRYLHYSLKTEEAYLFWSRAYIRFHGVRHPKDMGAAEVEAFLTHLTNTRRVSVSTHKQALSALLFLYREVIGVDLPWMNEMARPTTPRRIPSVLTLEEVAAVLSRTEGETGLLARLLYGTGMRLMEGLRLRVKDLDIPRKVITVREAKGGKDRVVMLPQVLVTPMSAPCRNGQRCVKRRWTVARPQPPSPALPPLGGGSQTADIQRPSDRTNLRLNSSPQRGEVGRGASESADVATPHTVHRRLHAARWMRCWQPEFAGISQPARSADTPSTPSAHASGSRPRPRRPTAARR